MRLGTGGAAALRADALPGDCRAEAGPPPPASELRSLHAFLEGMPDFRKARGVRYGLACYATIMIAARLAGYRGVAAFGEFAARLDQEQLRAAGAFFSPSRRRRTAPAASTFHYILSSLPPDALDRALGAWARHCSAGAPAALDGKDVRGASRRAGGGRVMLVAAVEHGSGLVLGQAQVGDKTSEIPAARELTRALDLRGRTVTLDALHAQQETARALVEDCGADYVVTAVKDNQPTMLDDLRAMDWRKARHADGGWEKGHGRLERRRCAALDLDGPEWEGFAGLRGRRQAFRIERERRIVKQGSESRETAYGLTSLDAGRAGPEGDRGPRPAPLGDREPPALRARLHLRRGPLPGARRQPAAQPRLPDQRRHLHRAPPRPLQAPAARQPALRRPPAGGPRRHPQATARLSAASRQQPIPGKRRRAKRRGRKPPGAPRTRPGGSMARQCGRTETPTTSRNPTTPRQLRPTIGKSRTFEYA